jgi:hypothetical protein
MFSKRHYEFLADFYGLELRTLGSTLGMSPSTRKFTAGTVERLANRLYQDNPRFNRQKFIARVHAVASGERSVAA